ncbi:IclR family transcriptional regulator [Trinickia soli]|uniref:IclR family transcriptional regulator n=1 Tax=Trinickia soli TaxID=380675 RepID=A0A2N7W5D0_9BURK|nr:IclR family transcriptional regulator [Trinickia soli]KAA0090493.1 IclR family transcriptional regulator [Paraburkholderia sp. T12-10]PMS24602.1 IclR family transcriptional regulator [Trinickia soli]CAB3650753.1 HTH-type transcriptional regulator TsaQ1/TsaQ2 [Trinickia soli]
MSTPSDPSARAKADKAKEGSSDEIIALSRGLTLLRRVASADAPISNRELAELTGIPKPTVSRITATLVSAGFLFQLPDSERFVLTASVLELSNGFLRNFDIRARARPFLIDLAERTSLSVHLGARDRLDMVVIDAIRPRSAVLVSRLEVGSRMDLTRTAVGRAYLAALAEPERRALMAGLQAALGDDWPHIHARLAASLEETRALGFAIATGEWYADLNAIAAGFVGPSGERYAINCGGAAHLCPREWLIEHAAPALTECVEHIVREIGGAPHQRLRD